jgi:hypothetical protein
VLRHLLLPPAPRRPACGGARQLQLAGAAYLPLLSTWQAVGFARALSDTQAAMTEATLQRVLAPGDDGAIASLFQALGPTIAECLGPDAVLHECAALISDPQAPQQPFHPDTPYRSEQGLAVLTAFIALQPVDESMGPTKFVPQSHTAAAHEAFNSAETKLAMLLRRPTWRGVLDTGEATLFDSRLIHCGGANESPRRRVLFYISFRAKEASAPPGTLLYDLRGRYSLSRSKSDGGSWALQDSHGATHWCHGEPSNRPDRVGAEP